MAEVLLLTADLLLDALEYAELLIVEEDAAAADDLTDDEAPEVLTAPDLDIFPDLVTLGEEDLV